MSMMNASYRRDRETVRVPVVMPIAEVTISQAGHASVRLDGEPYGAEGSLSRSDVGRVLEQIARELGTAVRAELVECDGERFTDYITPGATVSAEPPELGAAAEAPPDPAPVASPRNLAGVRPLLLSPFGIAAGGFTVGEEVVVCVVVTTQVADAEGQAYVRIPPALLASHPDVLMVGRSSGTVAAESGTSSSTGSVATDTDTDTA